MIPIHPQAYPGDPDRLRWVIPAGVLHCTGRLAAVPPPLDALLSDGTLAEIVAEPTAVVARLGRAVPGRSTAPGYAPPCTSPSNTPTNGVR